MIYFVGLFVDGVLFAQAEALQSIPFFRRGEVRKFILESVEQFCKGISVCELRESRCSEKIIFRGAAMKGISGNVFFAVVSEQYPQYALRLMIRKLTYRFDQFNRNSNKKGCNQHMSDYLDLYSDPKNVDTIVRCKEGLEEVKEIILQNIDMILERGVKIKDLIVKTEQLKENSFLFYKKAKSKNKSCCWPF